MKKITIALLALIVSLPLYAQRKEQGYGKFDFEIGFDVPLAAPQVEDYNNRLIPFLYFEGRWQLDRQPIDIGFHVGVSSIQRRYKGMNEGNYRAMPLLLIADWQFGRGKRFNPYVGMGAGVSLNDILPSTYKGTTSFALNPRVGVRCFKFMDVSAGWLITRREYSRLYANLGFYF